VLAIIITIMVLELKQPAGTDLAALQRLLPVFLSYVLSFIYVGIYWNNHHHLFHAGPARQRRHPLGKTCTCSSGCRYFPSPLHGLAKATSSPCQLRSSGVVLLMAAICLVHSAVLHSCQRGPPLGFSLGPRPRLEKASYRLAIIAAAIPLAFVSPWIASILYAVIACLWLVPDRGIERAIGRHTGT